MNKTIRIITLVLGTLCLSSPATAGFFDELKNKVNEKLDQTKEQVKQSIDDAANLSGDDPNSSESTISASNPEETSRSRRAASPAEDAGTEVSQSGSSNNTSSDSLANRAKAMLSRTAIRDPSQTGIASDVDIIGLRLGMTVPEAKAALQGYDATLQLEEKYNQLPRLNNSKYLHWISATSSSGEQVRMEFASPPHESTVVKVVRKAKYGEGARPTLTRTLQALKQKYGEPSMDKNNHAMMRQLIWLHDSKGKKMAAPSSELELSCTTAFIDKLMISQLQNEMLANCGDALTILLETGVNAGAAGQGVESNGLVGGITVGLTNVAELIRTNQETRKHIDKVINTQAESVAVPRF